MKYIIQLFCFLMVAQSLFSAEIKSNQIVEKGLKGSNKYKKHLENSTWVVPPGTLLAYEYVDGHNVSVSDQTVWVVNKFDEGYFFGNSYTAINASPSSQTTFVGSITPSGAVYMTFFPLSGNLLFTDPINGVGTFSKIDGKYTFVMQMNSAQNSLQGLSHWSYMIKVKPHDHFYKHLPGQHMSVPEFIAQF